MRQSQRQLDVDNSHSQKKSLSLTRVKTGEYQLFGEAFNAATIEK